MTPNLRRVRKPLAMLAAAVLAAVIAPGLTSAQTESQIREAQSLLAVLGYYNGPVDGDAGPGTRSATERFQRDVLSDLEFRLSWVYTVIKSAPMVGLLGTVVGMIFAFQQVATAPPGGATAPDLAEGIYQALVTTVGGLIVAIPALAAFAIFRNRIDQFVAEAAYLAQHVFGPLRRKKSK